MAFKGSGMTLAQWIRLQRQGPRQEADILRIDHEDIAREDRVEEARNRFRMRLESRSMRETDRDNVKTPPIENRTESLVGRHSSLRNEKRGKPPENETVGYRKTLRLNDNEGWLSQTPPRQHSEENETVGYRKTMRLTNESWYENEQKNESQQSVRRQGRIILEPINRQEHKETRNSTEKTSDERVKESDDTKREVIHHHEVKKESQVIQVKERHEERKKESKSNVEDSRIIQVKEKNESHVNLTKDYEDSEEEDEEEEHTQSDRKSHKEVAIVSVKTQKDKQERKHKKNKKTKRVENVEKVEKVDEDEDEEEDEEETTSINVAVAASSKEKKESSVTNKRDEFRKSKEKKKDKASDKKENSLSVNASINADKSDNETNGAEASETENEAADADKKDDKKSPKDKKSPSAKSDDPKEDSEDKPEEDNSFMKFLENKLDSDLQALTSGDSVKSPNSDMQNKLDKLLSADFQKQVDDFLSKPNYDDNLLNSFNAITK